MHVHTYSYIMEVVPSNIRSLGCKSTQDQQDFQHIYTVHGMDSSIVLNYIAII